MMILPIVLTGMPGSGKTTVGKKLARALHYPFKDSDQLIEKRIGLPCNEIFDLEGEAYFRQLEYEEVEKALQKKCVLSVGGGAFVQDKTRQLIQLHSFSIYLEAPLEILKQRLAGDYTRPLLKDDSALERLYQERIPLYKLADATVHQHSKQSIKALLQDCLDHIH